MTLEFDEFGRTRLQELAMQHGLSMAALVGGAARHSLQRNDSRGATRRVPRLRSLVRSTGAMTVTLELGREDWLELDKEAQRQGESLERLIEHAAVHLVADLEAGKLELGRAGDGPGLALEQG
jgi:hypothetical protein